MCIQVPPKHLLKKDWVPLVARFVFVAEMTSSKVGRVMFEDMVGRAWNSKPPVFFKMDVCLFPTISYVKRYGSSSNWNNHLYMLGYRLSGFIFDRGVSGRDFDLNGWIL